MAVPEFGAERLFSPIAMARDYHDRHTRRGKPFLGTKMPLAGLLRPFSALPSPSPCSRTELARQAKKEPQNDIFTVCPSRVCIRLQTRPPIVGLDLQARAVVIRQV